jgi:archaellum component FlaC
LSQEVQKNNVREKLIQQLRVEMDLMTTKLADMGSKIDGQEAINEKIKDELGKSHQEIFSAAKQSEAQQEEIKGLESRIVKLQ